ncbi:MAG: IPTL-CTERM sorting domain-containing protein [Betaproteobacteria bacterium]|nr:IPTL-CTERM sorting domain-containing protein [Betaproteobacteria bacterium]
MKINNWLAILLAGAALATGTAQAVQTVNFANITRNGSAATSPVFVVSGNTVGFDASMTVNGPTNSTTGLGLCLVYNLAATGDPTVANVLVTDSVGGAFATYVPGTSCQAGTSPNYPTLDRMEVESWAHPFAGGWPSNTPNTPLPVKLYDALFTLPATPAGSTTIGFAASSVAAGNPFTTNSPLVLCGKPTVTVANSQNGAEQGIVQAILGVSLSAPVPAECGVGGVFPVTLTLGGSAANVTDYALTGTGTSAVGSTVTINFPADGATNGISVFFTPVDDSLVEGTETVSLTVAAGSGNYVIGGANSASANITDNDASISVATTLNGAEGGANGTFTFTRAGDTSGALTVNFALTGGAATPADFTVSAGAGASAATTTSITFNPAATTAVLNVLVVDDTAIEGTETVVLTVGAGTGYSITGPNPASMNITDNDQAPLLTVSGKTDGAEPASNGTFTITRLDRTSPATSPAIATVNFTIGGTATRGAVNDYTLSIDGCGTTLAGNTLTIPAATTTVTVTVCVIDDVTTESSGETVILTLAAPNVATDYAIGAPATQTVNIADDDGPVTVTIAATNAAAAEPSTNGLFTVTRNGGGTLQLQQPLVVNLTIGGSATNGTDYALIATTVTILANQTTATIPVTVTDDPLVEGTETVILTVGTSVNYTVGAPSQATVNIADDESVINVSITATLPNAAEPSTNGQFTVTRTTGSALQNAQPMTVNLSIGGTASNGVDYSNIPSTVTILANQTTATIAVTVIDDNALEPTETVIATVLAGTGYVPSAPTAATVFIADEEIGVGVTVTQGSIIEGGTATFTISCTGPDAADVAFSFSGTYQPLPASGLEQLACGTPVVVNVPTLDDAVVNGSRTITLCLDSVTPLVLDVNANRSGLKRVGAKALVIDPALMCATVNIVDNDQPRIIPTMNTLGLMLLGLLLAAAAGFGIRRKA